MAKVAIKSEKITAFGGIFFVLDKFDSILSSVIDSHLRLRSKLTGYQYSEIMRAIFSVFYCGGTCIEDLNMYLKEVLTERPHTRVQSADTVLRGIEELATENVSYKHFQSAYEAGFSGFATYYALIKLGIENIVVNAADIPTTEKENSPRRMPSILKRSRCRSGVMSLPASI